MGGQRLLFSATLDRGVDSLIKSYLKNPKTYSLKNDRASASTMEHHVLVMHPGDKDLITAQIAARNGKTILLLKPNAVQIVLRTTSQKLEFQSVPCMVENHKQFVLAHSNYLKSKKIQHSLQLTSPPAVFMSMASHWLFT